MSDQEKMVTVRMTAELHEGLLKTAKNQRISLNRLCLNSLSLANTGGRSNIALRRDIADIREKYDKLHERYVQCCIDRCNLRDQLNGVEDDGWIDRKHYLPPLHGRFTSKS